MVKLIRAFWDYFRNSWEGDDGKFSYKRFSQYIFLSLVVWLVLNDKTSSQYGYYTMVTLTACWLLVTAIMTVQQVLFFTRTIIEPKTNRYDTLLTKDSVSDSAGTTDGVSNMEDPDGDQRRAASQASS